MTMLVGSCSICGGEVLVPKAWSGLYPPVPTCRQCGGTAKKPVIEMVPRPPSERRPRWLGDCLPDNIPSPQDNKLPIDPCKLPDDIKLPDNLGNPRWR